MVKLPDSARRDQDVVGLGHPDQQPVDLDRPHRDAVGMDHGQRMPVDHHPEEGRRAGVDQAEPDALAGPGHTGPRLLIAAAVEQERVVGEVGEVGAGGHGHRLARRGRGGPRHGHSRHALAHRHAGHRLAGHASRVGGPAAQPGQNRVGIAVQPVAQHDDIVAIVAQRFLLRLDHDGAVEPGLLLQPDMRVVPVGAALPDRVLVEEDLLRRHGRHRQVGHAVHRRGHQQTVPMDTGRLVGQIVLQLHAEQLALAQAELRARHAPACRHRPHPLPPVGVELGVADLQTAEPGRGTRAWHHGRGIGGSSGNTRLQHPGNAEAGQRGAGRPEQLAPTPARIAAEYGRCLSHFRRSPADNAARRKSGAATEDRACTLTQYSPESRRQQWDCQPMGWPRPGGRDAANRQSSKQIPHPEHPRV